MQIVRFLADYCEGDEAYANHRITMIVGIEPTGAIAPGEWVGYLKANKAVTPFVVDAENGFLTASDFASSFSTTVAKRVIRVGEMFSIGAMPGESPKWESVYQIKSVHVYS